MSKILGQLLGVDRRNLDKTISRLEKMTGNSGIDTQLIAEIITRTREKSRSLGLDPADTNSKELYFALLAKASLDSKLLQQKLSITDKTSSAKAAKIISATGEKLLKKNTVVCLQPAIVKKILIAVPPKRTLRILKFRSVESVTKRESPLVLYALAKNLEDKSWHSQVHARLKRLESRDVKERPVKVLSLPTSWFEKLSKCQFNTVVQVVPEIGSILILPSTHLSVKGAILLTLSLVLQAGQTLMVGSLPYRSRSLLTGLERQLPDIALGVELELKPIHGLKPSWHTVYQLLSDQRNHLLPEFDFILGDLNWVSSETRLASLVPELDFWVGTYFLGTVNDENPVSLHLIDVTANLVMGRRFKNSLSKHMQFSLWNEIQLRYLKHESLEKQIISQLTLTQEIV